MNPTTPSEQPLPSLQQLMAACLSQLMRVNDNLEKLQDRTQVVSLEVEQIKALLDGFTSSGASFGAYQTDQFTTAYLAILGPMLAFRLGGELQNKLIPELLKAGAPLARDVLEELAAYRQQQFGRDTLENAIGITRDPWADNPGAVDGSWEDLAEGA